MKPIQNFLRKSWFPVLAIGLMASLAAFYFTGFGAKAAHTSRSLSARLTGARGMEPVRTHTDTLAAPTLGNYPNAMVILGGATTVTPDAAPLNADNIQVATNTNFKGTFAANPATGIVRVTNAHPAGAYPVTVTAFDSMGAATTKSFTLTVQTSTACPVMAVFSNAADVGVGTTPASVAIGDFNGDGKQDVAVANSSSGTVSIRLGDGLGGFSGTTNVGVGTTPLSVAIGDFNGDGKQDFATANADSGTVSIRLGNGLGGFSGTTNVGVGSQPQSVAIGDFNGDGKQDFAAANSFSHNVSIRLGDGLGGFSGTTNVGVGTTPVSVAIGDFNGDGKQDFATANSGSGNVSIRLGDGLGGFTGTTDVGVGSLPDAVTIGDFNEDGKQDFAAANFNSNTVSIRLGDGMGGFSGATEVSVGTHPVSVAIGDFNGDSKQDFVTANNGSGTVTIRLGDGLGGFSGTTNVSVGSAPLSVAIGDFNGDGKQDFATANESSNNVSIRMGICTILTLNNYPNATVALGGSTIVTPDAVPQNATSIQVATNTNFKGTFAADPATGIVQVTNAHPVGTYPVTVTAFNGTQSLQKTFTLMVQPGPACNATTIFTGTTTVGVGSDPQSLAIGDFNGDGKQDVAVANSGSGNVSIRLGDGLGGFTGTTTVGVGSGPASVAIGDFNGDGKQDFAVANSGSNNVSIRLGDGMGGFSGTTNVGVSTNPTSVTIGDFNGDGKQDFAVANIGSSNVSIRLGDGLGGFSGSTNVSVGTNPRSVAIGDFNGDGKQDFAAANFGSNTVSIRLGDGMGGFSGTTTVAVGIQPISVAIGDFNGDGKQDFAAVNLNNANVSIRLGDGIGGFSGTTNVGVNTNPSSVAIGDFNGDGKQDFAATNLNSATVSIRLGDGMGGFSGTTNVSVGSLPQTVAIGDFNGDGRQDFATANQGSSNVSIRLGGCDLPPTLMPTGLTLTAGQTASAANIATAADAEDTLNTLQLAISGDGMTFGNTATLNGVTVTLTDSNAGATGVNPDAMGQVLADVATTCTATNATFKLRVTDSRGQTDTKDFTLNTPHVGITLGASPTVGQGTTSANLPYTATTGSPNQYSIDYDAAAESAGFVDVTNAALPSSPIGLVVPAAAPLASYNGTLTVRDGTTGCIGSSIPFTVTVIVPPILGDYANATVTLGGSTTVTPDAAPQNATSIQVATNTNFKGTFAADPATGVVRVTNAHPVGTYAVTVTAFNGTVSTQKNFTLTVQPGPACNATTIFTGTTDVGVGSLPRSVAIGDFNGDGKQDFATANSGSNNVSIRLGDGMGGFSGTTNVGVGAAPYSVAVGDFNGDGKQDFAVANIDSANVSIRLGDGLGGFSGTTNVSVGSAPLSVAIGDFNGDGKQDFATANLLSANVSIRLGDGLGGFSGTTSVGVGSGPYSVAIGDFNGDGKQDFVTANSGSANVSIRLGDGLGGFFGTTNVGVGLTPVSVAIGDFNGDGKLDFAVANIDSANVSIRLGDGLGGFSGTTEVSVGSGPYSVAIGDFNGDGKQDFAAANYFSDTVSIRLGDGMGGFSGTTNVGVGSGPVSVAIGDFNGDGKQDFATANNLSNTVLIRLGGCDLPPTITPTGLTLTAGQTASAANIATAADAEDTLNTLQLAISGDGMTFGNTATLNGVTVTLTDSNAGATGVNPDAMGQVLADVATTCTATNATFKLRVTDSRGQTDTKDFTLNTPHVGITLGASPTVGQGTTSANLPYTATTGSPNQYSIDYDAAAESAGFVDVGVTVLPASPIGLVVPAAAPLASYNGTLTVRDGTTGCIGSSIPFTVTVIVPPILGDYANATVTLGGSATVTPNAAPLNTTSIQVATNTNFKGTFAADPATGVVRVTNAHPVGTYAVTVAAFNGTVRTQKNFTLTVQPGPACNATTIFTGTTNVGVGSLPQSVAIGDFNGDGKQDVAVANSGSATVSIRLGDGLGGFSGTTNVGVGTTPVSVAIGDFNGDGKQDFATANSGSANVSIRLGDGLGGFSGTTNVGVGAVPYSVAIGDFNGDGKQDVATANRGSNNVSIRLGDGLGGFFGTTNVGVGLFPRSVAIGDFNGDGKQDFAAANQAFNTVSIRLGDGMGGFSGSTEVSVGANIFSVAIGDFNGDGKQDFATNNFDSNTVSIRLGDGMGGFSGTTDVGVGSRPYSVAIGDFNGDGKQDFAAANSNSANVSIRLGDGMGGFSGTTSVGVGMSPRFVAIGDFNGDGWQDFAAPNQDSNTVSIRLGGCGMPPTISPTGLTLTAGQTVSAATIGNTADAEDALNTLQLAISSDGMTFGNTATLNGMTVTLTDSNGGATGINPNAMGQVIADASASLTATDATFKLRVTDSSGLTDIQNFSVTINCPTITVTPATAANGFVGTAYSQTFTQTGGNGAITWSSTGTLPDGLTLDPSTGELAGTPTAVGAFTFTVRATDQNNCFGETQYTVVISGNGLMYYPLPRPIRLFDTRAPIPGFPACEYLSQPLVANGELVKNARITCDSITIPANAAAIVGNATVITPATAGFITLWPDGQARPPVSNLNFTAGQVVPNAFTVGLSITGTGNFRIYSTSDTDFAVDVTGYFAPPSPSGLYYHPLPRPIRLFDTRAAIPGFPACEYLNQPLVGGGELSKQAQITCDGITIPADAMAIVGNATVVTPSGNGFITLWPDGQSRPPVSNLNFVTGQVVPNAFTVGLGVSGEFRTFSSSNADFIVDITGYYSPSPTDANGAGLLYSPLTKPIRLFDTRATIPGFPACEYLNQPLIANGELVKSAHTTCDNITIPATAAAIVGNATVVSPAANGFITLWPDGQSRPPVSNLNYLAGQVVPNAFTVGLNVGGSFRIYSFAGMDFIVDITGFFAP
ncbi:MAG: FG-GAP-like repeat-containing protein [Blastocatellales bacterium]